MERLPEIMEILDKMNFFQGQRAGRELWNDKPFEVQEEDLENFKRDINTIRSYIWEIVKKLKAYEDAEEQGLLLRLPCKVGDTIYKVWYKPCHNGETYPDSYSCNGCEEECDMKRVIVEIKAPSIKWIVQNMMDDFGFKIYFLTKEEAEQALAKMKEV